MEIEWTDTDPVTGGKRFVQAEKFARRWSFKVRARRRTNWEVAPQVTRDMWETLLDALERRYQRREGVTEEDLRQVRAALAAMPNEESSSPQRGSPRSGGEDHTKGHKESREQRTEDKGQQAESNPD